MLGTDGANCGTEFWAGYYYCIEVQRTGGGVAVTVAGTVVAVELRAYGRGDVDE